MCRGKDVHKTAKARAHSASPRLGYRASSSAALAPPPASQAPPWLLLHLVSRACGKGPRCTALASGSRSDGLRHSLPVGVCQNMSRRWISMNTHVHHVIENNKRSPLCLLLITNTNLANAPVPSEQVVQVLAGDLVVQVLHKEYPVRAGRQFRLEMRGKLESLLHENNAHTVGLAKAMMV